MDISRNFLIVLIVLVFAGGAGTAYAGIVLPTITLAGNVDILGDLICTDCVGNSNIADNAVTDSKIGPNAVGESEIAPDAVGGSELKDVIYVVSSSSLVTSGNLAEVTRSCLIGDQAISGGASDGPSTGFFQIYESFPVTGQEHQWATVVKNLDSSSRNITVYVICLDTTP